MFALVCFLAQDYFCGKKKDGNPECEKSRAKNILELYIIPNLI